MRSVIYIDRNNLYYYGGNVHTPINFPFPKTAVSDMEIIDQKALGAQIADWVKSHKIEPSPVLLLLSSSLYFQKEIPENTPIDTYGEMKKIFLENIPFNDIHVQEIQLGKATLLIAINTDFVYGIRDIFHECGFTIEIIAPLAEVYGAQTVSSFSVSIAQEAIKKISKNNGFPLYPKEVVSGPQFEDLPPQPTKNSRLYIMVAVFFILVSILAALFIMRKKPKTVKIEPTPAISTPMKQQEAIELPTSSPSGMLTISKEMLTIEILNGSGVPGQADTIRKQLLEKDFNNITTGNAPGVQTTRTLILVKKDVSETDRNQIIEVIKLFAEDYTLQEKDDIDVDILITTSRQAPTTTP